MMFDGLKNMAGMASLMKDLPKMQQRMEEVKNSLGDLRVEATSAGNQVRVVASGVMEILQVDVDSSESDDLGAVIRDTVNTALDMARHEAQRRLAEAAAEIGLPMPPGGLSLPGGM
jgi:DNA-binding protein YbaB